ncbi:MAG: aspartate kinase [Firmicutes bacterium]|nr:aspartate kinase [Bacillota bacterium]
MSLIVQKFGGTSVATKERLLNVANIIKNTYSNNNKVVVVISAQGNTTDELLKMAKELNLTPCAREMDVLLSAGEQISMALLSILLNKIDINSISLTGWQAGIQTCDTYGNARIQNIFTDRIKNELKDNKVVIVAGFQGINKNKDITTMGRGGSDTSAVAIAAALNADECQIYTDVNGIYTADPKIVIDSKKLKKISYRDMVNLADLGTQVLNKRSVEVAKKYNVEISVLSAKNEDISGTKVCEIDNRSNSVVSIAIDENLFVLKCNIEDFQKISRDIIDKEVYTSDIIFVSNQLNMFINKEKIERVRSFLKKCKKYEIDKNISKISIVGSNKEENFKKFTTIIDLFKNIEIKFVNMENIFYIVVNKEDGHCALKLIHKIFDLDL